MISMEPRVYEVTAILHAGRARWADELCSGLPTRSVVANGLDVNTMR